MLQLFWFIRFLSFPLHFTLFFTFYSHSVGAFRSKAWEARQENLFPGGLTGRPDFPIKDVQLPLPWAVRVVMACHLWSLLDRGQLDGFVMREKVLQACIFRSQGAGVQDIVEFLPVPGLGRPRREEPGPFSKDSKKKAGKSPAFTGLP